MITVSHLAAVFVAALVYCVVCVLKPHRRCSRCKGTPGRSKRYLGIAGPVGKCRRCNGRKKHPRRFAKWVHWVIWAGVVDPIRQRNHDRGSGQKFAEAPARRSYAPPGAHYAARLRAAQRADRLRQLQARLQARTAPRAWQFA